MIDVAQQINSVRRRVGARELEPGEARTVSFSARPTTPRSTTSGTRRFEGNASGTIESCDPPHGFDATWEYGGSSAAVDPQEAAAWAASEDGRKFMTLSSERWSRPARARH